MQLWAGSTTPESTMNWVEVSSTTTAAGSWRVGMAWVNLRTSSSKLAPWLSRLTRTFDCAALYWATRASKVFWGSATWECQTVMSTGWVAESRASSGQVGRSADELSPPPPPASSDPPLQATASTATRVSAARVVVNR